MRGLRGSVAVCAFCALLAPGCGSGGERQDKDEPGGEWTVDVVEAAFPKQQRLAEQVSLRLRVKNSDSEPMPNVAVTVNGFSARSEQPGLSDPDRPVWIIDDGPRGGVTAYTNTWSLGSVPAGQEKEFVWKVTPVKAGQFTVRYRVSAGLDGKAKAVLAGGDQPSGEFDVQVSREPDDARVDPDSGAVVRD